MNQQRTRRRTRLWRGKQRTAKTSFISEVGDRGGQKLGVKSDAFFSGLGRRDQLFDRGKDGGEFSVVFLLQALDLAREIRVTVHQAAKLDECSHDCDVYLHGA